MHKNKSRRPVLPQQLSATLRFAVAVVIAAILALAWIGAEQQSHRAVETATAALSRGAVPPTQPAVEITTRREAAAAKRI